jgi:hypothetical protein
MKINNKVSCALQLRKGWKTDRFSGVRITIVERQCHRFYWGTVHRGLNCFIASRIIAGSIHRRLDSLQVQFIVGSIYNRFDSSRVGPSQG